MTPIYLFIIFSIIIYSIILFWFIIGIFKSQLVDNKDQISNLFNVSIIICVRNGEKGLNTLIPDLRAQIYNSDIEFIIVDDKSVDKTKEIILHYANIDSRIKYINSNNGNATLSYKKKALDVGIKSAIYDYLLFTDVNCRLPENWVSTMMQNYNYNVDYVIGLSAVKGGQKIVSRFQKIDFFMLMITSLGTTQLGYPLACSGQNQSYKKELFFAMGGFSKISSLIQGDDSIFLQLCRKYQSINTIFSVNKDSFVYGKTHTNWLDFLKQRIRWAGDGNIMWKYNKYFYFILIVTFLVNLIYLIIPFMFFNSILILILAFSTKFILEFLIYYLGSKKIDQKMDFFNFFIWFFIQIPYVVFMGILSFFAFRIGWRK